jgi:hypothetical protein
MNRSRLGFYFIENSIFPGENDNTIFQVLLNHGAKIDVLSNDNKTPVDVATNNQIKSMLGRCSTDQDGSADIQNANQSTFVPNYLQYPAIGHTVDLGVLEQQCEVKSQIPAETVQAAVTSVILDSRVRILKIRVASLKDLDFIEIDLPQKMTRYNDLLEAICKELNVEPAKVERIRKLPNTRLRRDIEVTRLTDYTELELVLLLEK